MEFRERLFLFLSGIFLTSLVVGNIIGTTKFVNIFGLIVPAGVLAYPFTFLTTDLICELYGKRKAQTLVWIGFFMNIFLLLLMSLGHFLPDASGVSGAGSESRRPGQPIRCSERCPRNAAARSDPRTVPARLVPGSQSVNQTSPNS